MHRQQIGSREAIEHFTSLPGVGARRLAARWLLNIAYMTLGEYPERVPRAFLIPRDAFRSKLDVGPFRKRRFGVGLGARGPNMAGGSIFDDFTGDGLADLLTTSIDADLGASLFVNRGDGTFEDRSAAAGLSPQIYVLNLAHGDFDNDGDADVVLLRGAWQARARLSLLRNKGNWRIRGCDDRQRARRASLHRVGRVGRLRSRRPARSLRLRRISSRQARTAST